jgi:hypothetical protein
MNQGMRKSVAGLDDGNDRQLQPQQRGQPLIGRNVAPIGLNEQIPPSREILGATPR